MKRVFLIGRFFKGRKSTVIDLAAYRALKHMKETKQGGQNGSVSESRKKEK